ncbi:hypothetical protein [Stenotrophomonas humi]|uniref:hypothetical protein n=1 Tax=Stenotrophomonas humi TaxID=405444 RepID=UPI00070C5474|nr:hypothetical protein [Stenotrophomonas humi]
MTMALRLGAGAILAIGGGGGSGEARGGDIGEGAYPSSFTFWEQAVTTTTATSTITQLRTFIGQLLA